VTAGVDQITGPLRGGGSSLAEFCDALYGGGGWLDRRTTPAGIRVGGAMQLPAGASTKFDDQAIGEEFARLVDESERLVRVV
jgi:hypothetical protein